MIFEAHFSMREWPHFFAGFCHQAVVLWSAFFDTGFTSSWAKRSEIPRDGQQHVIYHGIDCFWFPFHPAHCMGELAQGIKATFEGNALQIHIVDECGLLHHASDEVVGNKVHPQFAFDHVRGAASQDIHLEMGFDLAEVELDAPAPAVKKGSVPHIHIFFMNRLTPHSIPAGHASNTATMPWAIQWATRPTPDRFAPRSSTTATAKSKPTGR